MSDLLKKAFWIQYRPIALFLRGADEGYEFTEEDIDKEIQTCWEHAHDCWDWKVDEEGEISLFLKENHVRDLVL